VDVEKVVQQIAKLPDVVVSKRHMFMCSDPGQGTIAEDVIKEKLNRVVVSACSPSLHELTFRDVVQRAGMNPYLYEHANIREQVSWCSKSDTEGATDKAIKVVAAAVAKVRLANPLEAIRVKALTHVAIIGGGLSGLRSAIDLSNRGLKVTLIEKSPFLGGNLAKLDKIYPENESAKEILSKLISQIKNNALISIQTSSEVISSSGFLGNLHLGLRLNSRGVNKTFDIKDYDKVLDTCPVEVENEFDHGLSKRKAIYMPYVGTFPPIPAIDWANCTECGKCKDVASEGIALNKESTTVDLNVGAIILATGFDSYEPFEGEYAYRKHPEVITLPQLNRMLDKNGPTKGELKLNGRSIRSIGFIHCVGSRQVSGINEPASDGKINDYCSRYCCTATLHSENEILERYPDVKIYDFYQDIRTYGRGHEDYYDNASKKGVLFFRWRPESPPIVEESKGQNKAALTVRVKDTLTWNEELDIPVDLVILSTGMLPHSIDELAGMLKLPRSADRFLQEVHPKLKPVELAVKGVMVAGTCQSPMDVLESSISASAAAVKASAQLSRGYIELDPFVAKVNAELCTGGDGCNAICVEKCSSLKAISIEEKNIDGKIIKIAKINTSLCNGCGICVAACPKAALSIEGWRLDQFEAMVDAFVKEY